MTMFDGRTRLSQQVVDEVRQHFGEKVFETLIPRTTRLAEAPSFGKPIIYYDKYSAAAAWC
jgi:chromosome partitioning protein